MSLVWRLATSPFRILPDFLVIGVQKCGTTSLFNHLNLHPGIARAYTKGPHFFDYPKNFKKGVIWYRANYPTVFEKFYTQRILRKPFLTGEATPYYFFHPHAARRTAQIVPQAKFIVVVRNPVDRAFSHYYHERHKGKEDLPFEQALQNRESRIKQEAQRMLEDENYYSEYHQNYSYLLRGIYWQQIEQWYSFYPKDRFLVIKSEDYFRDANAVLQECFRFLGLPPYDLGILKKYNAGKYDSKMDKSLEAKLNDYFKPHNQKFYAYIGKDLGW